MHKTLKLLITLVSISISSSALALTENAIVISGSSTQKLSEKVSKELGVQLGKAQIKRFNDGEVNIKIEESVRNKDVYIIQTTSSTEGKSVNDNIMELYLLTRTLKRSSAKSITAVIPYFGYARQDRKTEPRVPISASDVSMLIESSGVNRVVAIDLHSGQIQGFFRDVPLDNLYS